MAGEVNALEGNKIEITVSLLSALSYQWQVSTDGGLTWQNLSNGSAYGQVNTSRLSIIPSMSLHGYQYRCEMTTLILTSYSEAQTLAVTPLTKILEQPQDGEAWTLDILNFSVTVEALNPKFQWQVNNGQGWENLSNNDLYLGAASDNLTLLEAAWYMHHYQYRCLVSGDHGATVASEPATLSMSDIFSYVTQPVPGETCSGKALYFTLTLDNAEGFAFQWQASPDQGQTWVNIADGSTYSQTNTPELGVIPSMDLHNFSYRCRATRGQEIFTSDEIGLSVLPWTSITAQPLSVLACSGSSTAFSLTATGSELAYQWQVNTGSGNWINLSEGDGYQGTRSPNLGLQTVSMDMNGYQYRCILKGNCPAELPSSAATLSVGGPGTWRGTSSNWHAASNWCGGIPTTATDITIRPDVPFMPKAAAAFCRDLTIQAGASIAMTGDFTIQGIPTLLGPLTVGSDTLKLNGGPVQGNAANLQTQASSKLVLGGSQASIFVPAAVSTLHTLVVRNTNGVNLTANLSLEKLVFSQGKLFLNAANLHMRQANNISGVNTSRYIVTNDDAKIGGFLTQPISSILLPVSFPVGTAASYSPAEIKLQLLQSPDFFSVRVFDRVYDKGTWGTPVTSGAVNKTWLIEKADTTKSTEASVKLGWQAQDELPNFKKNAIKKGHYKNGKWEFASSLLALIPDALNLNWSESGGYTDFSPFTVMDETTAEQLTAPILPVKVFLEGAFSTNKLRASLTSYLPLSQPFNNTTYNYGGLESVGAGFFSLNKSIVDWVMLELRTSTSSSSIVARQACFILDNGMVVALDGISAPTFPGISPGNYYVVVRHRNHLAVMSAQPILIDIETTLYDFTTGLNKYFGNDAKLLGTNIYGMYGGDTNQSGLITTADLTPVRAGLNQTGYILLDSNLSALITTADITIINPNLNKYSRVP